MDVTRFSMTNASVFLKCLVLMAGATILVATVLSLLNIRTTNTAIDNGIRELAEAATSSAAAASGAALRFGNVAALEEALDRVLTTTDGAALRAIAVNAQGETLAELGAAGDVEAATLAALARTAATSGMAQVSDDGFVHAVPAFAGSDTATSTGAIAILWTSALSRSAAQSQLFHQPRHLGRGARSPAVLRRQPPAHAGVAPGHGPWPRRSSSCGAVDTTGLCLSPSVAMKSARSRATCPTCNRSLPTQHLARRRARASNRGANVLSNGLPSPCRPWPAAI